MRRRLVRLASNKVGAEVTKSQWISQRWSISNRVAGGTRAKLQRQGSSTTSLAHNENYETVPHCTHRA
jgi:hypothetical protein